MSSVLKMQHITPRNILKYYRILCLGTNSLIFIYREKTYCMQMANLFLPKPYSATFCICWSNKHWAFFSSFWTHLNQAFIHTYINILGEFIQKLHISNSSDQFSVLILLDLAVFDTVNHTFLL